MSQSKEEKKHFYLRHNDALMNSTKLSMKAKQSILLSKAENTVNAYESDWDDFVDWCNYQKVSYFPATPETIVNYINDLADYAKANTIARRISAISENYNASGARENPCMSPLVKQALRGIRRLKGTFQQGKTPILLDDIEDILECIDGSDIPKIQKLRDKAILLIGFMGAFRRSEIAALTVENLKFSTQGLEIFVASSKADQEGQGAIVAIPSLQGSPLDAVRALKKWLTASGITSGPVFRGFTKSMSLRKTAISDKSIAEIVKKYIDEYDYYDLLACGAPNDEFDSYSRKFANTITEKDSIEDIARLISETIDKAFAEEIKPEKFLETAKLIRKELYGDSE